MPTRTMEEVLQEHLTDPEVAEGYLMSAIEGGDPTRIVEAINTVLRIRGLATTVVVKPIRKSRAKVIPVSPTRARNIAA